MSNHLKSRYLRNNPAIGGTWEEYEKEHFSREDLELSNFKVMLIGEIIKARNEKGLTQKQLEEISGVKQPIIARMERGTTNPQIDTLFKILVALGKTIEIKDLDTEI